MPSKGGDTTNNFGNVNTDFNFSNLFGGGNVFNLGAGSSNTSVITSSTDLSSFFEDSSTKKDSTEFGNIQADIGASVGVGVGGGSGSAGAVDKTSSYTSSETMSGSSNGGITSKLPIIGGILAIVIVLIMMIFKRRK